jgi:hypothetical protein
MDDDGVIFPASTAASSMNRLISPQNLSSVL